MYPRRLVVATLTLAVCAFAAGRARCQSSTAAYAARLAVAKERTFQHRWAEAIGEYQRAIRIDSGHAEVFNRLGEAYLALGQYKDALKAFKRAAELDPAGRATHYNLGSTLTKMRRYQEAVDAYWVVVGIDPDDGAARFWLAEAYLKLGKNDIALMQHEKLKEIDKKLAAQLFDDIFFRKATDIDLKAASARQP